MPAQHQSSEATDINHDTKLKVIEIEPKLTNKKPTPVVRKKHFLQTEGTTIFMNITQNLHV